MGEDMLQCDVRMTRQNRPVPFLILIFQNIVHRHVRIARHIVPVVSLRKVGMCRNFRRDFRHGDARVAAHQTSVPVLVAIRHYIAYRIRGFIDNSCQSHAQSLSGMALISSIKVCIVRVWFLFCL